MRLNDRIGEDQSLAGLMIVRGGFSEIIKTSADKLAGHEWILIPRLEFLVLHREPGIGMGIIFNGKSNCYLCRFLPTFGVLEHFK